MISNKLDNPVWYSLSESHQEFAVDYGVAKFYHPDYCPFGGVVNKNGTVTDGLSQYAALADSFFIVGEKPSLPPGVTIRKELVCLQMISMHSQEVKISEAIVRLGEQHQQYLFDLVNLVQPGYFKKNTSTLGDYFGIFQDETLVAVTGERMQMNDYIEISAVVTHPEHTGKGYAKQLVAHGMAHARKKGKTPYLHVVHSNEGAISLYRKLGFETRREISFWSIAK